MSGVFGISVRDKALIDVREEVRFGLYALQHRGQEAGGITVNDDGVLSSLKDLGLVPEIMTNEKLLALPKSNMAIGHCRGVPTKSSTDAQPIFLRHAKGVLALGFDGFLTNSKYLRNLYQQQGVVFHTLNDAEIIAYVIRRSRLETASIEEAVAKAMTIIEGAYSVVLLSPQKLIAFRDKSGLRPLCIGSLADGQGYAFASESCGLDAVNRQFVRDVNAGEIVIVKDNELTSYNNVTDKPYGLCIFEHVYTARPDSVIDGQSVHESRKLAGRLLARRHPVEADVVIGVPDSGLDASIGYAEESGIPHGIGFLKNKYIGRTFIQPTQSMRENSVKIKLNPIAATVKGKRVIMVDDSIVRGTTSKPIVKLLRQRGATEVHVRMASPMYVSTCIYGTDDTRRNNLIAARLDKNLEAIAAEIGADSVGYLDIEDVYKITPCDNGCKYCMGCFTGEYPIEVKDKDISDTYSTKIVK